MLARYYSNSLDRFLSPDPSRLGVDRLNPQSWNAYAYVLNNPIGHIDPNGLFEVNFHQGWTYMLAKQAGFSEAEARTIAKANNDMDHGKTNPFRSPSNRRNFHGFEADRGAARGAALGAQDLGTLGGALHHYQDTFSHEGFGAKYGHIRAGHKTHNDPAKAIAAALGSFGILSQKAGEMGKEGFGAPDQGLLSAMADADANVLDYDRTANSLTLEVDVGKAHALARALKKQGYTVAIDGIIQ